MGRWLNLAQLAILTTIVGGCSNSGLTEISAPPGSALRLGDGSEIESQSLRCIFRQSVGASDDLSLQLQYLSAPGRVAFAAYLTNPEPGMPFVATPREVERFVFEAFVDGREGYSSELERAEVTVQLDELPQPASLTVGAAVPLHGQLDLAAFTMPATSGGEQGGTLQIAAGSVAVDCEAVFQRSQVLN